MSLIQFIELIVLILVAGFFTGSALAVMHINQFSLEIKRKMGLASGKTLSDFNEQPLRFIATGTIGYLLMLVIFSVLLGHYLKPSWLPDSQNNTSQIIFFLLSQFLLAGIFVLLFTLFFRSLFRAHANSLLTSLSWPITVTSKVLYPVIRSLNNFSNWMLEYLFNVRISDPNLPFDLAGRGSSKINSFKSELDSGTTSYFENALNLPQYRVRQCMTPRKEILSIGIDKEITALKQAFKENPHSRIMVYKEDRSQIVGYIHQMDLLEGPRKTEQLVRPIQTIPETMTIIKLIAFMKEKKQDLFRVIDEYGATSGIVTMADVLSIIFGKTRKAPVDGRVEAKLAEKEFLFSGRQELKYLTQRYGLLFPDTESETLSGYIISKNGSIPKERAVLIFDNFEFEILRVSNTRIKLVKMLVLE